MGGHSDIHNIIYLAMCALQATYTQVVYTV